MRLDKFTQKAQEAVLEAQNLAQGYNHPAIEPEHLLSALITQEGGVVPSLLKRIGTDATMLQNSVQQALGRLPRATGSSVQVSVSRNLNAVVEEAQSIADNMKDD
ncbi:MAG: type VI secretion system ATPase TssH, partial [Bacteroidetes bacterium]|nr:type VI secretion system ATPase TssH [Bacteroidota bacterium]